MTILNFYNDKRGSTSLNDDCAKWFLKRSCSREQKELQLNLVIRSLITRNIVVEPLIEFEGSNDNILSVSPKEHTTDPENMVYTWFDNYIF